MRIIKKKKKTFYTKLHEEKWNREDWLLEGKKDRKWGTTYGFTFLCGNSPLWFEGKHGNMYKITILVHQIRFIFQSTFMSDFFWVLNSWIFCRQFMFTWFSVSKRELCKNVLKIIFTWFPFLKLLFLYI